jgi:hypothetical protein
MARIVSEIPQMIPRAAKASNISSAIIKIHIIEEQKAAITKTYI